MTDSNNGSNRGFAGMDPERQREIASEGGKAAHESGGDQGGGQRGGSSEQHAEAGRQSHQND